MNELHTVDIWKDQLLSRTLKFFGIESVVDKIQNRGSPIEEMRTLKQYIINRKPKVVVEFGVYVGTTSIWLAHLFDKLSETIPELSSSFIIAVDSWLLDLKFAWKHKHSTYFDSSITVAGHDFMYFVFLANVLFHNVTHRIIPMQSSTSNSFVSMIAHNIRPDIIYLDASHANPDVFIDLEGTWTILNNDGLLICDDYNILPVKNSIDTFLKTHNATINGFVCNNQCWIEKK